MAICEQVEDRHWQRAGKEGCRGVITPGTVTILQCLMKEEQLSYVDLQKQTFGIACVDLSTEILSTSITFGNTLTN